MEDKVLRKKGVDGDTSRMILFFRLSSSRIFLGVALLSFFLIRVAFALLAGMESPTGDARSYVAYAHEIMRGGEWLSTSDFAGHQREPVYPLLLALLFGASSPSEYVVVYLAQALMGIATVWAIYRMTQEMCGSDTAILAFLWSGFYPPFIRYTGMLLRETLIILLIVILFRHLWRTYDMLRTESRLRQRDSWIAVIAYVVLIHTDARYLFFLPCFAALFVWSFGLRNGLRYYVVSASVVLVLMVPWQIRNYIAYDGFVLVNTRTLDLRPEGERTGGVWDPRAKDTPSVDLIESRYLNSDYPTDAERQRIKDGYVPPDRSPAEIEAIREDVYPPSSLLSRKWFWFIEFWRPARFAPAYYPLPDARFQSGWSWKHNVSMLLSYGTLIPLMLIGAYALIRQRNRAWLFLAFPIVVQTILHVIMWGRTRYRIPVDAFVIVLAMVAACHVLSCVVASLTEQARMEMHE